jgi:hypothetical protein
VLLPHLAAQPDFALQSHDGLEEVHEQAQVLVDGLEQGQGLVAIVALTPDGLTDRRPVLLLDLRLVVLLEGAGATEGDLFLLAGVVQVMVDELAAAVGVEA